MEKQKFKQILNEIEKNKVSKIAINDDSFSAGQFETLCNYLADNTSISVLEIHDCNLTDVEANIIFPMLEQHQNIQHVNLSCNFFGDGSVQSICNCLKNNKSIASLYLYRYINRISAQSRKMLGESLLENNSLIYLKGIEKFTQHGGVRHLKLKLVKNEILASIEKVTNTPLGLKDNIAKISISLDQFLNKSLGNHVIIKCLNEVIQSKTFLLDLELKITEMDYQDSNALKEMVLANKKIANLRLVLNELQLSAVECLADIFSMSNLVSTIEIKSDILTKELLKDLGSAIQENDRLQEIKISTRTSFIPLKIDICNAFLDSLQYNTSLKSISLNNPACEKRISRISKRNKLLEAERSAYNETLKIIFCLWNHPASDIHILPIELINHILFFVKLTAINELKREHEYSCVPFKYSNATDYEIQEWRYSYNDISNFDRKGSIDAIYDFFNSIQNNIVVLDSVKAGKLKRCLDTLASTKQTLNEKILEKSLICSLFLDLGFYHRNLSSRYNSEIHNDINKSLAKKLIMIKDVNEEHREIKNIEVTTTVNFFLEKLHLLVRRVNDIHIEAGGVRLFM